MDFTTGFDPEMLKNKKESDSAWNWNNDMWFLMLVILMFGNAPKDNHSFDKDYITYQSGMIDAYRDILKGDN